MHVNQTALKHQSILTIKLNLQTKIKYIEWMTRLQVKDLQI